MSEKSKSLFEKLYEAGEATLKAMEKPFVEKKIRRKLEAARDDAEAKKIEAEGKLLSLRKDFSNYDINKILEQKALITKCTELMVQVSGEHMELFGEEIRK